jgi:hypothetical protein
MTEEKETYSIDGREIRYEFRMVDIKNLKFYEDNPRIATIIGEKKGGATQETIDECLWDRDETHKWKRRIEADGGLIHPLVVYNGQVLEGNTRLCCYRHLYEETKDDRWKTVKCNIVVDKLTRDDIYRLLCTEHIEGKIPWDPYEKANFYRKMREDDGKTLEEIKDIVDESTTSIFNKIRAFKLMVENGVINKEKYSHFEQLVLNGDIRDIKAQQDPDIEEKVIKLIKKGTCKTAQDIRKIGTIYKHKAARKRVFDDEEDVEQVWAEVKAKAPMTDSPLMKEIEDLIVRIRALTREDRDLLAGNTRDRSKVKDVTDEMISLCDEMDIKVHVPKGIRRA